jgi:hypothetical protein
MQASVGKPLLALVSAACIAVPAGIPDAAAAPAGISPLIRTASTTPAGAALFDPLPPVLRLLAEPGGGDIGALAAASATPLELLTFPYHNVYGIGVGVGSAVNSVVQLALLPASIASLVAVNKTDQVPAFVQTTLANLEKAIPGVTAAVQNEIQYDINLFSQLGAGMGSPFNATTSDVRSAGTADGVGALAAASATPLELLTFPYHNVYGVGVGVGSAVNSVVQLGLLPASIASLVAVNKTDQVPAFVQTTLTNLQKAIPGVTAAVQNEVAYDKNLFGQPGGASTSPFGATALDAGSRFSRTAAPVGVADGNDVTALTSLDRTKLGETAPSTGSRPVTSTDGSVERGLRNAVTDFGSALKPLDRQQDKVASVNGTHGSNTTVDGTTAPGVNGGKHRAEGHLPASVSVNSSTGGGNAAKSDDSGSAGKPSSQSGIGRHRKLDSSGSVDRPQS